MYIRNIRRLTIKNAYTSIRFNRKATTRNEEEKCFSKEKYDNGVNIHEMKIVFGMCF